jgi:hypothetical protein
MNGRTHDQKKFVGIGWHFSYLTFARMYELQKNNPASDCMSVENHSYWDESRRD